MTSKHLSKSFPDHSPDPSRGVFTSVAVRGGRPMLLHQHLQRLTKSCTDVYKQTLPDDVERDVCAIAETLSDSDRIRINARLVNNLLTTSIESGPLPGTRAPLEVEVLTAAHWNSGHKWIDRSMLPNEPSLFVDEADKVLELDIANVFAVVDQKVWTPPLDGRILPGIGRQHLATVCVLRESALSLERLISADEVFATNALRGVVPVVRCGSQLWPSDGKVTERLAAAWEGSLHQ